MYVFRRPVWREELTQLTGYALPDVVECGEELWNFYEKMFPLHKVCQPTKLVHSRHTTCTFNSIPVSFSSTLSSFSCSPSVVLSTYFGHVSIDFVLLLLLELNKQPLRADPNATAAVVARKKAEQQQQQLAEAAALAATAMAAGAAPASGSDSRVGSTSADKRQPQQQPVAQPVMP